MREVKRLVESNTTVVCLDEAGMGNACHEYEVYSANPLAEVGVDNSFARVWFQNGPIQEFGVNGCQNEDLLLIVIDRLQGFQAGQFACRENAIALTHAQEALMWLERRTLERKARGVEGLNIK